MPVDRGLCEADVTSRLRRWVGDSRRIDVTDDDRVSRKAEKEPGPKLPVFQDYGEAVHWFRLAAEQGNADAQVRLGGAYLLWSAAGPRRGGSLVFRNEYGRLHGRVARRVNPHSTTLCSRQGVPSVGGVLHGCVHRA